MRINIELTGTSPLLCHNVRLADPDDEIVKAIAAITSKRKKTEDDRIEIARLEWWGGLYVEDGMPVMPTGNVRKALIQAGKISKQGTQITRALAFTALTVPVIHDGPASLDALYERKDFHHRASVGIGAKRTMRTRPCFPRWAVTAEAELFEDVMDLDDFKRVAARAGIAEGLGDNRVNGYGRFEVKVVKS